MYKIFEFLAWVKARCDLVLSVTHSKVGCSGVDDADHEVTAHSKLLGKPPTHSSKHKTTPYTLYQTQILASVPPRQYQTKLQKHNHTPITLISSNTLINIPLLLCTTPWHPSLGGFFPLWGQVSLIDWMKPWIMPPQSATQHLTRLNT